MTTRDFVLTAISRAKTLYDRPADMFRPMSLLEKHDFLMQLRWKYPEVADRVSLDRTVFTEHDKDGGVRLRRPRPGFLVSSTSWTEDEDFQLLVEALDGQSVAVAPQNGSVSMGLAEQPLTSSKGNQAHLAKNMLWATKSQFFNEIGTETLKETRFICLNLDITDFVIQTVFQFIVVRLGDA